MAIRLPRVAADALARILALGDGYDKGLKLIGERTTRVQMQRPLSCLSTHADATRPIHVNAATGSTRDADTGRGRPVNFYTNT